MKSLNELTLYDIMAEDFYIWVSKTEAFGYNVQIDDDNGKTIVDEINIHPFAVDSFADFCRRYLVSYDRAIATEVK